MQDIKNCIERIAKLNGKEVVSVVSIEECSELQKEITKMLRERGSKDHLAEEMADVYICLAELRCCYGITDQYLEKMMTHKILRTSARKGVICGREKL